ncbi:hypothetical protein GQ457_08G012180 [Hibiscus cannabinus]
MQVRNCSTRQGYNMKTERKPHLIKKLADMKCQRVDGPVVPGMEVATEAEHLLSEPKSEHVSVDRVLCFGKENLEKHLKMEDFFSCALDYSWRINCCNTVNNLSLFFLHTLISKVKKKKEMIFECMAITGRKNQNKEQIPRGVHGQGGDDLKLEVLDGLLDEVDEVTIFKQLMISPVHVKVFNWTPVTDTICSTIEHMQSFDESDDDEKPLVSFILSTKSVKSSVEMTKGGGALLRQKRLRKPTSRSLNLIVSSLHLNLKMIRREAKDPKWLCDRRKHQRMWTLAEVIKLVDGIAQFGVGKWTDIKRLLFASSAYRTPVDLRDKWRNLLRSSSAHKPTGESCSVRLSRSMPYVPYQCMWYAVSMNWQPFIRIQWPVALKNHLIVMFLRPNNQEQLSRPFSLSRKKFHSGTSIIEESICNLP